MKTSVTNGQLTITITRNQYSPEFNPNRYAVIIDDTQPVDTSILRVSATDDDPPVSTPTGSQLDFKLSQIFCFLSRRSTPTFLFLKAWTFAFLPLPQGLFSDVRYDLLGDETTPVYFRIDSVTGDIFVRSALNTQGTSVYRVGVFLTSFLSLCKTFPHDFHRTKSQMCVLLARFREVSCSIYYIWNGWDIFTISPLTPFLFF